MKKEYSNDSDLIDIHEVTKIFKLSIESVRKYKALGLIKAFERVGRKDLFDKASIFAAKSQIESYRKKGKNLDEIAKLIETYDIKELIGDKIKKILIIEDEEPLCLFLKEQIEICFSKDKLRVHCVKDGHAGIELAKKVRPDLIILDVLLTEEISGIQVYETLMKKSFARHSKFITISGTIKYEPKNSIFIKKPFATGELIEAIKKLIGLKTIKDVPYYLK